MSEIRDVIEILENANCPACGDGNVDLLDYSRERVVMSCFKCFHEFEAKRPRPDDHVSR